jgi:thiol-disulfide isomerase/thioredoxin
MQRYSNLPRLGGALVALGLGLAVLWQAGVFDKAGEVQTIGSTGQQIAVEPADTSVDTVAADGLEVGLREGDVAPDFAFSTFAGARMRLSDYRGHPVFLNFWASWCGPCRAELPEMEVMLRDHAADGLIILGMNNGERLETAQRFLTKLDVKLTAYGYDPGGDVARRYSIIGMPTSYFIDADGVITGVYALALNDQTMQSAVQQAIAGHGSAE